MGLDIDRLRADFAALAKDGKITETDVSRLLRRIRAGGLTQSEGKALKKEVARYLATFTPEGATKIDTFIKTKLRPLTVLDDPTPQNPLGVQDPEVLKADVRRVRQEVIPRAELIKNGVSGHDAIQKYLADCYLLAAIGAVAKSNPALIEKAFKQRADGTYDVTLYRKKGRGYVPVQVHIDADLPYNDWYHLQYGSGRDERELWPALLEKAFAQKAGSYAAIEGGVPGEAMSALTGQPSGFIDFRGAGVKAEQVFEALALAVKEGRPATASTFGESSNAKYTNTGLFSDHAYSVWGVGTKGGVRYVELRNPWGNSEPAGNGRDDGVFKIEFGQFMKLFANVEINGAQ